MKNILLLNDVRWFERAGQDGTLTRTERILPRGMIVEIDEAVLTMALDGKRQRVLLVYYRGKDDFLLLHEIRESVQYPLKLSATGKTKLEKKACVVSGQTMGIGAKYVCLELAPASPVPNLQSDIRLLIEWPALLDWKNSP